MYSYLRPVTPANVMGGCHMALSSPMQWLSLMLDHDGRLSYGIHGELEPLPGQDQLLSWDWALKWQIACAPSHQVGAPKDQQEEVGKMILHIYYDDETRISINWSPKQPLLETQNTRTTEENVITNNEVSRENSAEAEETIQQASYSLNKAKAIEKKIRACDRPPVSVEHKSNNSILKFSTGSFELLRKSIRDFYEEKNFLVEQTYKQDENGQIEQDIVKIFTINKQQKKSRHHLTINVYRTTSTVLVNGPSIKYRVWVHKFSI